MLTTIVNGGFGMVDHKEIFPMKSKQILMNLSSNHSIKEIINKCLRDPESRLNPSMKYELDDILPTYTKTIKALNYSTVNNQIKFLTQDAIA